MLGVKRSQPNGLAARVRYYEFSSQIVDFDDDELEKLSVFAKHLAPLLREERPEEDIDLSQVLMTHYKLDGKMGRGTLSASMTTG